MNKPHKKTGRNPVTEVSRFVCACGIVWFHLGGPHGELGHIGRQVFVMIAIFFAAQSVNAWSRKRVLQIWLFWSAVYAAMKVAQALATGGSITDEFQLWMLLTGPSLPLWFLPFIFIACGLASTYVQKVTIHLHIEAICLGALALAFMSAYSYLPVPLAQWSQGLAAVVCAIALFRANWIALAICLAPLVFASHFMLLIAAIVAALALFVRIDTQAQWPRKMGRLSLPVYVLHPGVYSVTGLSGGTFEIMASLAICVSLGAVLMQAPVFRNYL